MNVREDSNRTNKTGKAPDDWATGLPQARPAIRTWTGLSQRREYVFLSGRWERSLKKEAWKSMRIHERIEICWDFKPFESQEAVDFETFMPLLGPDPAPIAFCRAWVQNFNDSQDSNEKLISLFFLWKVDSVKESNWIKLVPLSVAATAKGVRPSRLEAKGSAPKTK